MRLSLIFNPKAGTAEQIAQFLLRLPSQHRCELRPTAGSGDARRLAAEAVAEGIDRILVAGGDGTVSEVINGIAPHFTEVELAILPLGTGNDLARVLGLAADPFALACEVACGERTAEIDVIEIAGPEPRYCVNVANGGIGGVVAADVKSATKRNWGVMAYWVTAMAGIGDLQRYRTRIDLDDDRFDGHTLGVVVSNGRYVGGGFPVAPRAVLDDGQLDITVIPTLPMLELMSAGINLTLTRDQLDDHLQYYRSRHIEFRSEPAMPFSIDGEPNRNLGCDGRVVFSVLPRALRIAVGNHPPGLSAVRP